jgi:hypothetical protein
MYLYTNYSQHGRVLFRDLLPVRRPFGSNETEQEISDDSEIAYWGQLLEDSTIDISDLLGGKRYYLSYRNDQDNEINRIA